MPLGPLALVQGERCYSPTGADDHSALPVWEGRSREGSWITNSDLGIVAQAEVSPTLHICDVPRWCQPVCIPGAGGQLIVGEGSIGVKCVQVQEYQYHRTSWVTG